MYCTVCDKPHDEVRCQVHGPVIAIDAEVSVQLVVCDECVAALDEVAGTQPPGGDGGSTMHCSWCRKVHGDVGCLLSCARYYRVGEQIERVVHDNLFLQVYGDRKPVLLAEVAICDECIELCKEVVAEKLGC